MTGARPQLPRTPWWRWAHQIVSVSAHPRTHESVWVIRLWNTHSFGWSETNLQQESTDKLASAWWYEASLHCYYKTNKSGCLPQTRHARDCRKKGSRVYMSEKVWGCLGSHCSTARLADTYRAVALTGFIAVYSADSGKHGPGEKKSSRCDGARNSQV